jgi:preprotein translocase subunit SecB
LAKNLKLITQYIKDLSFENFAAQTDSFSETKPKIHIDIKIQTRKLKSRLLEVTLLILLEAKSSSNKIFLLELSYAASFSIKSSGKHTEDKYVALVDCPNIMFPFVRQLIFNITQNSGFTPLSIDYIDFSDIFNSQKVD